MTDSRYGEQVKVSRRGRCLRRTSAALISYLRRIRNIGEKRAKLLIDRFGAERVLDAIDEEPAAAFRRVGLNPFRAQEAAASWNELRTIRRLHLLLAPHGLAYLAKRISDEYPNTAHRVITENPYELTRVFGVGFKVADRIARADAESVDAIPGRVSAALVYALSEAEGRAGSTCLPSGSCWRQRATCSASCRMRTRSSSWSTTATSCATATGSTARRPGSSSRN